MATVFLESGSSATYGLQFYSATSGTVSSSSAQTHSNNRSILCDSTGSNVAAYVERANILADAGRSISLYVYFGATPSAQTTLIQVLNSSGTALAQVHAESNNTFTLRLGSSTQSGLGSYTTGAWIRLCLAYTITSTTVNSARLYKDGTSLHTLTNQTLSATGSATLRLGLITQPGASKTLHLSDIYIDDSSSLADPGDIQVTPKLPNALNTNNFDTLGGSGANRYNRVSDRALSETNYISHVASTNVEESFGIESASQGDVNISGKTFVASQGWVWAKISAAVSAKNQSKTTGTTLTLTVSGAVANNTYLIAFAMDGATGTISCTDNASTPNTYIVDSDIAAASPSAGNVRLALIRARIVTTTSLTTITITHPSVAARAAVVQEFAGIRISGTPTDVGSATTGANSNASAGPTGTPTGAYRFAFAGFGVEQPSTSSFGAVAPFVAQDQNGTTGGGDASNISILSAYTIWPNTADVTASATNTNAAAVDWAAAVQTYIWDGPGCAIIFNGATTPLPVMATSQLFLSPITDSAAYPSASAAIGLKSSSTAADTFLYECGILIAYINVAPPVIAGSRGTKMCMGVGL